MVFAPQEVQSIGGKRQEVRLGRPSLFALSGQAFFTKKIARKLVVLLAISKKMWYNYNILCPVGGKGAAKGFSRRKGEVFGVRILGIDPGYAIIGFGVIDHEHGRFTLAEMGAITTNADMTFEARIRAIYLDMCELIKTYKPDEMSIEKLFFNTNQKTAIDVAQARGVIILPAIMQGIPIYEYTPLQVKSSIVGYGRAEKKQVQEMVRTMLHLREVPKPDDTADAVALAITHALSLTTRKQLEKYG